MKFARFQKITGSYPSLRIAIAGDFCLDRYFDIDPALQEVSIETGLPVHNITRVRCQPGAAGTILNNLVALGVGRIIPIGICGDDGEGFELRRALEARRGTDLSCLIRSAERRTFTYTKPLVFHKGQPPVELSRLDLKNWVKTPDALQEEICGLIRKVAGEIDAMILLDQVDVADTGIIAARVLDTVREVAEKNPRLFVIADSRRGLKGYPPIFLKMNRAELTAMTGRVPATVEEVKSTAAALAGEHGKPLFVTLAEAGIVGAAPGAAPIHRDALPLRGEIDIVGAGDSVTANLAAALAGGATIEEAVEFGVTASSVVIHQLGTTGAATPAEIESLMERANLLS